MKQHCENGNEGQREGREEKRQVSQSVSRSVHQSIKLNQSIKQAEAATAFPSRSGPKGGLSTESTLLPSLYPRPSERETACAGKGTKQRMKNVHATLHAA